MKNEIGTTDAGTVRQKRRPRRDLVAIITRAATDEFKERGYARATTSRIAQTSGVTEAQIFRYFGSKPNLFRETIFNPIDERLKMFVEKYNDQDFSHLYTTDLQKFIRENIDMFMSLVVVQAYANGAPQGVGEINSLKTYFDRGAATLSKLAHRDSRVDPKLMVRVSFAAVLACIMFEDWIFPPGMATEAELTNAINEFVNNGVSATTHPDRA